MNREARDDDVWSDRPAVLAKGDDVVDGEQQNSVLVPAFIDHALRGLRSRPHCVDIVPSAHSFTISSSLQAEL